MSAADRPVWFVGDLDDPWIFSLAEALPAGTRRIACAGDLPAGWPGGDALDAAGPPRVVVLQRTQLTPHDSEWLARLRSLPGAATAAVPRVILVVGPYVRHADLERWSAPRPDRCDHPGGDGA